jgi:hypothetical protein
VSILGLCVTVKAHVQLLSGATIEEDIGLKYAFYSSSFLGLS